MPKACYIHIPFCSGKKCNYCSFISYPIHLISENDIYDKLKGYIYTLIKEIDNNYQGELLSTLYFGGGTPSIVPAKLLEKVLSKLNFDLNSEITIELNPEEGNYEYIKALNDIGFNRISVGSQTFNDNLLKLIGRKHDSKAIIQTVKNAKKAGFKNISLDLIYGLPNQTLEGLKKDIEIFLDMDIQHISTYGLKIEGGSFWGEKPPSNIPDEDLQADMYLLINNLLEKSEFTRYEVSNFAKEGFESRHNLTYWNNDEYYGFGVSAHGYLNGIRYSNYTSIAKYMESPLSHEYGRVLNKQEQLEEEIFLGFRKTEGINIKKINKIFNIDFDTKYSHILKKYKDFIIKTNSGYAFNLQGTMLSNEILPEFLE